MARNIYRSTLSLFTLAGALTLGGCVVAIGNGEGDGFGGSRDGYHRVSSSTLDDMIGENRSISLGDTKKGVLERFDEKAATLMGSVRIDGSTVEEWRVRANDRSRSRYFQRWYYFVDGTLVEFSNDRVDYRDDDDIVKRWVSQGS